MAVAIKVVKITHGGSTGSARLLHWKIFMNICWLLHCITYTYPFLRCPTEKDKQRYTIDILHNVIEGTVILCHSIFLFDRLCSCIVNNVH